MLKEKDYFINEVKVYPIPEKLQTFGHPENTTDLEDLSQNDTLYKILTSKGYQDLNASTLGKEQKTIQIMSRQLMFHLPPFLCPQIWKFYRMNLDRIYDMFQAYHPLPLWCLCLLFQLNICTFAIKPSYANSVGLIRDSKAPAKKTLHEFLTDSHIAQQGIHNYKCFHESTFSQDHHDPPLPVYMTDCNTLNLLLEALPEKKVFETTPLRHPIPYSSCFLIRGKKYIPYIFHDQHPKRYILLVRIVSAYTYFVTYDIPSCISFDPLYILLRDERQNNQLFCSVDDAIYITDVPSCVISPTLSSRKRKQAHQGKKNQKKHKE